MDQVGESGQGLASARAGLAARDAALADADRELTETLAAAHAVAVDSIARIEAIRADLDGLAGRSSESPAEAHELNKLLIARQHEIAAVVREAEAATGSKTAVLQRLIMRYTRPSTS